MWIKITFWAIFAWTNGGVVRDDYDPCDSLGKSENPPDRTIFEQFFLTIFEQFFEQFLNIFSEISFTHNC